MPSKKTNEATRREWRELGFFYELDDKTKEWRIRGSRAGLLRFVQILRDYSKNPRRRRLSEHDHLGPYMYLEVGTWNEPVIDGHWIAGTPDDLSNLSILISEQVLRANKGAPLRFRDQYSPGSSYELVLELADDEFDPASADTNCW